MSLSNLEELRKNAMDSCLLGQKFTWRFYSAADFILNQPLFSGFRAKPGELFTNEKVCTI